MSIRPVSRRLPSSQSVWDETNIPMCVVVTPFEGLNDDDDDDDDDVNENGTILTKQQMNYYDINEYKSSSASFAQPISAIPKCLSCGAPHPTAATHFRPSRLSSRLVCYFCGETSSTMLTDQQEIRSDEHLDPNTYDKVPPFPINDESPDAVAADEESDEDDDAKKDDFHDGSCLEFRVPVELKRKGNTNNDNSNIISTWQFPAMVCPPVWWIVIDGTVGNGGGGRRRSPSNSCHSSLEATRNYWTTIGTTLQRTMEEIPPHVHVGLVTATGSRFASWDLRSAVPHVKQYPYSYDPTSSSTMDTTIASTAAAATTDDDGDSLNTNATTWDLCLVPANGLYKANIEAAIRAMVDGAISSSVFHDKSSLSSSSTYDEEKKDGDYQSENNNNDDGDEVIKSSGIPLGLTIEIILEFMEQAHHPGQDDDNDNIENDDDDDDGDDNINNGEKTTTTTTKLRYAGGKILCLLGNPPLETAPPTDNSMSYVNQSKFYQGGVAGACFDPQEEEEEKEERGGRGNGKKKNKKRNNNIKKKEDLDNIEKNNRDLTDLTPSNMQDYAMPLDPDDLFVKIGKRCARAALGVDLFVVVPEEDNIIINNNKKTSTQTRQHQRQQKQQHIPWYGLPLLRPLVELSGAPGPLMFGTANSSRNIGVDDDDDEENNNSDIVNEGFERLCENILARTPWQAGIVFGAQMRLRLPPGFRLEATPIENEPTMGELQLAPFLSSGGLSGPATTIDNDDNDNIDNNNADEDDDDDDEGLWIMGTCDPHTSFTIDLEMFLSNDDGNNKNDVTEEEDKLPYICEMEGYGDVTLKPVMQTCTLFTCVETDGAEPVPNYYTVCKMRVTSLPLLLAEDAESIYDALDPEALSVVLYHKIVFEAYFAGLVEAQKTAEDWIQSFLVCVYQSAQQKQAEIDDEEIMERRRRNKKSEGRLLKSNSSSVSSSSSSDDDDDDVDDDDDDEHDGTNFVGGERLLDEEGGRDLDEDDILMGQGHSKVGVVSLLMFAIMQSDALRPCSDGTFQPSMDARLCAIAQMASMTPKVLAESFAPSLSLWSLKDDEPIIENLPLSQDGILSAIEDFCGDDDDDDDDDYDKKINIIDEDGILLLESPQRVILFRSGDLTNAEFVGGHRQRPKRKPMNKIGTELESAILSSLNGFRTSPPQCQELEDFLDNNDNSNNGGGGVGFDDIQVSRSVFLSMLLEDKPTASGDRNFIEWKSKIAELVREEVETDDKPVRGFRRFLPFGKK